MNILILGAGVMQIPAIKEAKKMGHFVLCADGNPEAPGKEFCDLFYPVDLKDREGLLNIANKFHEKHGLNGVFTVGTDFSASVAFITERLELPGPTYSAALNATDKVRMRSCFKNSNVPSPHFVEYSKEMDLKSAVSGFNFPLVVKPVDSMGARGVKKVNDLNELSNSIEATLSHSRSERAIIEEYLDGPEFSIDALVYNNEIHIHGFASRDIQFPPYFVEMGHTIPTDLASEDKERVIEVFKQGVKALGITYGYAKGDMKLTDKGPKIGEIAARLSGGFMSGWTYPYSSGVNLLNGAIKLALGENPSLGEDKEEYVASERALISIPGKIKSIIKPGKRPKAIKDIFLNVKEGDIVNFPKNNVEKCGNIIALGKDFKTAIKINRGYIGNYHIRLEENNSLTEEFLFNGKPENRAFDFDEDLYSELEEGVDVEGDTFYIKPVEAILKSRKKDWNDLTVKGVLKELSTYYKVEFDESSTGGFDFYKALINGSLQGVLYYLDSLEV